MAEREDLFTTVHKGLRSMMYDLSGRLQTNDFANLEQTKALVVDLENDFAIARSAGCMLCVFHHHAEDEEGIIFSEAKKFNGSLIAALIEDHNALSRREFAIEKSAHALLATADPADRLNAGAKLNQSVNELLAAYFTHMNREESELVPAMREHFTDEQMVAMRGKIMGGMPPERLFAILGWMLPALNVTELSDLFISVRNTSPPPVTEAIAKLCAARVDPQRWDAVKLRVGL